MKNFVKSIFSTVNIIKTKSDGITKNVKLTPIDGINKPKIAPIAIIRLKYLFAISSINHSLVA